jgi:hypothetical protein
MNKGNNPKRRNNNYKHICTKRQSTQLSQINATVLKTQVDAKTMIVGTSISH